MNNIKIIIQGPLITFGQGPNNNNEGFNSYDTIVKNIHTIQEFNFDYLITTWEPNNKEEIKIISELRSLNYKLLILEIPDFFDPDNRYKHHFALSKALKEFSCQNDDIIIKIRTDMLIHKEILTNIINKILSQPSKLLVSERYLQEFYIGDFIYAGKVSVFESFLNGFLNYGFNDLLPSIAEDIGIKYMISQEKIKIVIKKNYMFYSYFIFLFIQRKKFVKKWHNFVKIQINTMNKSDWESIIWRDKLMYKLVKSNYFLFEEDNYNNKKNIIFIIKKYIYELKKYYKKRNSI